MVLLKKRGPASTEAYVCPVDALPKPVPWKPYRWAPLQSEPYSSGGYQPNELSQHCNRRPRAPAFATSIESQEIEIHPIVPATQASTSWTLQCGKKQWELGKFALFPCPTMDAVPQKHQGGTVKQVLAICASAFREKSSRLLGARHRNPPS
jgi:hypothetical protein